MKNILLLLSLTFAINLTPTANADANTVPETQGSAERDQAARDKFNDRWFKTKVPKYLEERKAEEAAYSGPTEAAAVYEEIMAYDFKPVSVKLSSLVNPKLYSSLQHQMKSKYLLDTLKAGQLIPRISKIGNDEETSLLGVYLELHTWAFPKPFAWGDVELHFDYSLLDRNDYYVSPFWDYGQYGPFAAAPVVNRGRVAFYFAKYFAGREQNEIVFANPVPLDALTRIVVKKGQRQSLLLAIQSRGLKTPTVLSWEALIVERP